MSGPSYLVVVAPQIVDSPAEVADKADRIITMLPSSPNVIEVYTGSSGILKCVLATTSMCMNCSTDLNYVFLSNRKVKKGSLLIDSSTIDPTVSKEMAAAAEKMGAVFMDAPVSGGKYYILAETTSVHILSGWIILPDSWLGDMKLKEN